MLFEEIVKQSKAEPTLIASTLLSTLVNLRRDGKDIDMVSDERLIELFTLVQKGDISKDAVEQVLIGITEKDLPPSKLITLLGLEQVDESEIESIVSKIVQQESEYISERGMAAMGKIIQLTMKELGGKAEGRVAA